jgi:hypothetical protein
MCIHYDGGRVAANESLIAEISRHGLRRTTTRTGLDRKTIRAVAAGRKVKISTLAKVVAGIREKYSGTLEFPHTAILDTIHLEKRMSFQQALR